MADYLLDTNILLRLVQTDSSDHRSIMEALALLADEGATPFITPQVLIEFWAVATRPLEVNGFGWTPEDASAEVERFLRLFTLLPDRAELFEHWLRLVQRYGISGKKVHDARLVAVMVAYGVERLLTLNGADFKRFSEISALHPDELLHRSGG